MRIFSGVRARALVFVLVGWLLGTIPGCERSNESTHPASPSPSSSPRLVAEPQRFDRQEERTFLYDLVAADLEGDGDPDIFINWHKESRWELFENREGRFHLRNPEEADPTGLLEATGIASLRGDPEEVLARLESATPPTVALWRSQLRWHVAMTPRAGDELVAKFSLVRPVRMISLQAPHYQELPNGGFRARVRAPTHFHFVARSARVGVEAEATLLLGGSLEARESPTELGFVDPHGMAWVDVRGDARPDLFVVQGGFSGILRPPLPPKHDRFFVGVGTQRIFEEAVGAFPAGFARGRQAAWVDVDADGSLELCVGNVTSPNALYRERGGVYEDVAPELGLDLRGSDVFRWLDLDGDGFDDFVGADESGFQVALNRGGVRFEQVAAEAMGLTLPKQADEDLRQFPRRALRVLDVDDDGDLDLWLTGLGPKRLQAVYRFHEGRFEDATEELGLPRAGVTDLVVFDIDNDGDIDGLSLPSGQLFENRGARGFETRDAPSGEPLPPRARGLALDVDGDGLQDAVLVTPERTVLRNASAAGGRPLRVVLEAGERPPVGSLVRVFLSDGRVLAQRLGSAHTTWQSQSLLPLHFGVPEGQSVERLVVRWPGGTTQVRVPEPGAATIRVIRSD